MKKIIAVMLCVCVLAFAGCSNTEKTTDNDTDNLSSNNNIANIPVKKKRQNYFDKFSMTNPSSFPWSFYQ